MLGDVDVTFLTDPDWILVTSVSEDGSLGTAVVTDGLPTPPAVVLPQSNLATQLSSPGHRLQSDVADVSPRIVVLEYWVYILT